MNQQNYKIDFIKALAIIMVVLHHCLAYYNSSIGSLGKIGEESIVLLQTFHVPFFMMIAGYLCHEQPVWNFYKKKILRVFVPFITFTILKFIYSTFISTEFAHGGSVSEQIGNLILIGTQYWFVYAILGMYLLAPIFWNRGKKFSKGLIAFVISYLIVLIISIWGIDLPDWFQIRRGLLYLPYFTFGCMLRQIIPDIYTLIKKHERILMLFSVVILCCYIAVYWFYPVIRFQPIRIIVAIIGLYVCYKLFDLLPRNIKILHIIAKYSLQIMFFDSFYRILLFAFIRKVISINVWIAVMISIPTIVLGIISCIVIQKIPKVKTLCGL